MFVGAHISGKRGLSADWMTQKFEIFAACRQNMNLEMVAEKKIEFFRFLSAGYLCNLRSYAFSFRVCVIFLILSFFCFVFKEN